MSAPHLKPLAGAGAAAAEAFTIRDLDRSPAFSPAGWIWGTRPVGALTPLNVCTGLKTGLMVAALGAKTARECLCGATEAPTLRERPREAIFGAFSQIDLQWQRDTAAYTADFENDRDSFSRLRVSRCCRSTWP